MGVLEQVRRRPALGELPAVTEVQTEAQRGQSSERSTWLRGGFWEEQTDDLVPQDEKKPRGTVQEEEAKRAGIWRPESTIESGKEEG